MIICTKLLEQLLAPATVHEWDSLEDNDARIKRCAKTNATINQNPKIAIKYGTLISSNTALVARCFMRFREMQNKTIKEHLDYDHAHYKNPTPPQKPLKG